MHLPVHVRAVYETNQMATRGGNREIGEWYRKELCSNLENAPSSEDGGAAKTLFA